MPKSAIVLAICLSAGAAHAQIHPSHQVIATVESSWNQGALSYFESASPWPASPEVDKLSVNSIPHEFFGQLYVLECDERVVQVRELPSLKLLDALKISAVAAPRDLVMVGSRMALISDHDSDHLWWLDTWTGDLAQGPSLRDHADADGYPDVTRMALVGQDVYVQMQRYDRANPNIEYGARLAVLGPAFNPLEPAVLVGSIDLQGFRPDHRMQANAAGDKLWLSAPGLNDDWGWYDRGIEEVDLINGVSLGFVMTETHFGGDLGGFVMVDDNKGFAIVHTSIVASTHLRVFERNVGQLAELHVAFGRLECIAHDRVRRQIFFPVPHGGPSAPGGVLVFSADTHQQLSGLIELGGGPRELIVVQ